MVVLCQKDGVLTVIFNETPNNGLDIVFLCLLEEPYNAIGIIRIRNSQGTVLINGSQFTKLPDPCRRLQHGIFRMNMQICQHTEQMYSIYSVSQV